MVMMFFQPRVSYIPRYDKAGKETRPVSRGGGMGVPYVPHPPVSGQDRVVRKRVLSPLSHPLPFLLLYCCVLMSSGCGLGEHVRTTSPYTFTVAALSIILGSIPVGMGLYGPWVALLLGGVAMTALVCGLGTEPAAHAGSKKIQ